MGRYELTGQLKLFDTWAIVICDDNIGAMYRSLYQLEYFYKPRINKPIWSSHISVIRGEKSLDETIRAALQDKAIKFEYTPGIITNGVHMWLNVICSELDEIRSQFNLDPSPIAYHLSIGNICNGSGFTSPELF